MTKHVCVHAQHSHFVVERVTMLPFYVAEGQWMNDSSPEPSPTKTKYTSKPDESAQSVEIQGVPAEQNDNRTLSDLFSTTSSSSQDLEGHSFFDSLVAPGAADPFSQVSQQTFSTSRESSELAHQLPEAQSLHEPSQQPLEPLMLNDQEGLQDESKQWPQFQEAEYSMPPLASIPKQISQDFNDPLNVSKSQGSSNTKPNISQEPKQLSAPPTPDGEWVRSKQTEAERRNSAWIATPQTSQFLVTIGSGMLNPSDVDQQFLTSPGLVIEARQVG